MNFLQLVQDTATEAGIAGAANISSGIASLTGQQAKVVGWVNKAWMEIQRMHDNWKFMRFTASWSTVNNQWLYSGAGPETQQSSGPVVTANSPTIINGATPLISKLADDTWRIYDNVAGVTTEVRLTYADWDAFRDLFRFSSVQTQQNRPAFISLTPYQDIALALIPDNGQGSGYTVYGDCYAVPTPMTVADATTPWMPTQFHELITWLAVLRYAGFTEASAQYEHARNMIRPLLQALRDHQQPAIMVGGPLA